MNEINIHTFFVFSSLYLFIFSLILLSRKSYAVYHHYEECQPKNCGNDLTIAFPFYIQGLQPPYCGYPGFQLDCNENGYPTINLTNNAYVIENISYTAQSFHVYNNLFSSNSKHRCFPAMKNTTLSENFDFVNITRLFLLSNCMKPLPENLLKYKVVCEREERDEWELAIWDKDENLRNGLQRCGKNVVAPVDNTTGGDGDYVGVLKRGFRLNWKASDCTECAESGGLCGFFRRSYQFRCFCPDRPHVKSCKRGSTKPAKSKLKLIVLLTGVSFTVVAFFSVLLFAFTRRKYMLKGNTQSNHNIELFLEKQRNLVPRRYKYSNLKKITNSFSDKLGEGGFASVYKGNLPEGNVVAVKILKESMGNGEEFINEVASISRTSHVNIVSLLGFCFEGSKRALIYEFMPNGSLEKFIYSSSSLVKCQLGWDKLFQIAVGIARGIEYLHQGCNMRILHFDIKPHNILLDKDFNPKVSDFGLAKLCPNRSSIVSVLGARGTIGYIAPELVCRNIGEVSHKSDVYSYGMMVLEMVGERKNIDIAVDCTSEIYFPHWIYKHLEQNAELNLNRISSEDEKLTVRKMIIVGLWCIQTDPTVRPPITKVVEMLEGNMESLQIPPKPYLSSPRRQEQTSSNF